MYFIARGNYIDFWRAYPGEVIYELEKKCEYKHFAEAGNKRDVPKFVGPKDLVLE